MAGQRCRYRLMLVYKFDALSGVFVLGRVLGADHPISKPTICRSDPQLLQTAPRCRRVVTVDATSDVVEAASVLHGQDVKRSSKKEAFIPKPAETRTPPEGGARINQSATRQFAARRRRANPSPTRPRPNSASVPGSGTLATRSEKDIGPLISRPPSRYTHSFPSPRTAQPSGVVLGVTTRGAQSVEVRTHRSSQSEGAPSRYWFHHRRTRS